jgi:hypothetical protein
MAGKIKEIVIPQEDAVFWLDKNGRWHNKDGKFQHKRIIDYFHSCIKRDRKGYYLYQANGNFKEKVYFTYEDQALFVFDVLLEDEIILILNTKKKVGLKPRNLFIKNDSLYMRMGHETVKFVERGLMKIAKLLENENNLYYIRFKDRRYTVPIYMGSTSIPSAEKNH